ncbi:MAG TPA: hypothetical protein VKU00_27025 [Chthonomonadaceae bacterium]|nr:hypothetical protein [Chthonomonadaceae bacterium]
MAVYEYELEALPEYEALHEYEAAGMHEGEAESEQFFGSLARLARRAIQSPTLRRIGLAAARRALSGLGALGSTLGGTISPGGATMGRDLGAMLGRHLTGMLPAREGEGLHELNPVRKVYPDAMLEHLGHAAMETHSEAEAEALVGAMIPLIARANPAIARSIQRAAPGLVCGAASVARQLRRTRATRPLVRVLPTILQRTAADIARQEARGRAVPPQAAVRTLARQTYQVINSPQSCVQAWRRSRALDRRYHAASGPSCGCAACRRAAGAVRSL